MKDLYSNINFGQSIVPQIATSATSKVTVAGVETDIKDFEAAAIVVALGESSKKLATNQTLSFTVESSATSGGSFEAVDEKDLIGAEGGDGKLITFTGADTAAKIPAQILRFGYVGENRFLKVEAELSANALSDGGQGTVGIAAFVAKGRPHRTQN